MPDALFTVDGDRVVPTEYARGPWDPDACHGGPVAALLARQVEALADERAAWHVARTTVELLRPVPLAPLMVAAEVVRPGGKVSLVEATVSRAGDGVEVARARALRIRLGEVAIVEALAGAEIAGPEHGTVGRATFSGELRSFAGDGVEARFVAGSWDQLGPVTVWMRLAVPVVAGEPISGLQRATAVADFANGVSRMLDFQTHLFINPDLTVHLLRPVVGEWVALEARSFYAPTGSGLAEATLHDSAGRVGRATQSLLVDTR